LYRVVQHILYNAILKIVGVDIIRDAFNVFFQGFYGAFLSIGGAILMVAFALMVPMVSAWVQLGVLVTWLLTGYLFIPTWIFQIAIAFLFSFIFLTFFLLFTFRIFVIWILAVLSPLAFVCFVLPQTKKYWDEWLKHLLEWMFVGIFALFFLALGLKAIPLVPQPTTLWFGFILIPGWFFYYFFLFVYLLIVVFLLQKAMPSLAAFLIDQTKAVGGMIWTRGIKPAAGEAIKRAEQLVIKQSELAEREKAGGKLTRGEKAFREFGRALVPMRWAYKAIGVTPEFVAAKRVEKEMEKFEKAYGKDIDTAAGVHLGIPIVTPEMKAALGLYLAKMKGAKGIEKLSLEEQRKAVEAIAATTPKKLEDFVKHKPELIDDEKVGETIRRTMVSKGLEDPDAKKLIEIGVSEDEAIRKAAFKKAVDAMKVADIENLALSTLENKEFQEMVVRFKDSNFIRRIGEEKGTEYIEALRERAKELGAKEIAKTNLTLLRQSVTNPGFKAVFPPIEGAESIEKVEELGARVREEIRKRKEAVPPKEGKEGFIGGEGPRG
jgi:hypothetical protein